MRLSEAGQKLGLLHPERTVREVVARKFCEMFSTDPEVMDLIIESTGKYGRLENRFQLHHASRLPQTRRSIAWCLEELRDLQAEETAGKPVSMFYGYRRSISSVITHAEVELLKEVREELRVMDPLNADFRRIADLRIDFSNASSDSLWKKLEERIEVESHTQYLNELDLNQAYAVVEGLVRDPHQQEAVLHFLGLPIGENDPFDIFMKQGLAIYAAGLLRVPAAIPDLVRLLGIDDDWYPSLASDALVRIGSDSVVQSLSDGFLEGSERFRVSAALVLENIDGEFCAQRCKALFDCESARDIKGVLGSALALKFDSDYFEPLIEYSKIEKVQFSITDDRTDLVAAAILMEFDFPERAQWLNEARGQALRMDRFEEDDSPATHRFDEAPWLPESDFLDDDDFSDSLDVSLDEPTFDPDTIVRGKSKIGRNDPCPCGSGKKFKKCCLNS